MTAFTALLAPRLRRAAAPSTPSRAAPLDLAALVGADGWNRLPAAVQRRFGCAHGDTTYIGHLELGCSRIGGWYALATRLFGGPLTGIRATGVTTTVRVSDDGRGGVVWERCFHRNTMLGADHVRTVRSTKQLDRDGRLFERTDGGLSMALDVFEERGSLVFQSRGFSLVWGRLRLPVPALLTPGTCRVMHTDLGGGFFRFTLSMVHPLWGQTFHQSGVFADPHTDL
ncbi:DUF4166 domain-containing protein [Rhizobacter sp. OV335]|uniref:DUF4166 domain-containing protein n=1 Tax=Rhizobacter sp. OV335 TaxID=1500264 RepID=UPI00091EE44B|nr:DUF4166 domain-containing protein [Rhizobacter sp. OV335]SHM62443.1 protein of unknown function [Rhizobacter sp. OV335]